MERRVKGSLFVEYVRMLRSRKDVDWSRYLKAEDHPYLAVRIDPEAWYPMETFSRFGLGILDEIAHGDPFLARAWGRVSADHLVAIHGQLLVKGDPRESLMRVLVLRGSFFDFDAVAIPHLTDRHAEVHVNYGMSARAEQAASLQTLGVFGRLVELAGGRGVLTALTRRLWEGDPVTAFTVDWDPPD
ncbi:MAG: hypothetical protein JJE39_14670 [Vicinamibacteria bacterium]|nr:hypothetical protein [Vicinamibacteria bacterium]